MANDEPNTPPPDPVTDAPDAAADGWTRYQLSAACDGAKRGHADALADAERAPVDPAEEWRTVPDWPAYQVSNRCRVRSLARTVRQSGGRPGYPYTVAGCVLKPIPNKGGLVVSLYRPGARKSFRVNTLVRRAFGGSDA